MQKHWVEWGPPAYIPVAGYFKLGVGAKNKRKSRLGSGEPSSPATEDRDDLGLRDGNLDDLSNFFGGLIQ